VRGQFFAFRGCERHFRGLGVNCSQDETEESDAQKKEKHRHAGFEQSKSFGKDSTSTLSEFAWFDSA
jgi:hypothetical protein